MKPRFLLASGSPRRRDLLHAAGFEFKTAVPAIDELESTTLTIRELTLANAARKGRAVARANGDAVVLAADTLVALAGEVIAKPRDLAHAREILCRLSGRTHDVCSSVFVGQAARRISFSVFSQVRFRRLSPAAIASYLAQIDPLDKAGAYAAQENGSAVIAQITGSFTNVVGLPMAETRRALRAFGIAPNESRPVPALEGTQGRNDGRAAGRDRETKR